MTLNQDQINALLAPLNPGRVRQVKGNAHLEAWDVRRWLTRIFGFGGWEDNLLSLECVNERSVWEEQNPLKGRHSVVYRCTMRLTIKDVEGNVLGHYDDGATGDSQNQPSLGDAHDQAMKTAMSQALKRCAVNLGDQFGLGLYDGGKTAAVIGRTLAHPDTDEYDAREDVTGGEMPNPEPPTPPELPVPAADPVVAPSGSDDSASPDAVVEGLRERVIEAMHLPTKEAMPKFAKLAAEAKRLKVHDAQTTTPGGSPVTVGALIQMSLNHVTQVGKTPPAAEALPLDEAVSA